MLHESLVLKTGKEKLSYALGMNFGGGLRSQGLDLDPALFARAFADAFENGKTAMSEQEMEAVLTEAAQDLQSRQSEKDREGEAGWRELSSPKTRPKKAW